MSPAPAQPSEATVEEAVSLGALRDALLAKAVHLVLQPDGVAGLLAVSLRELRVAHPDGAAATYLHPDCLRRRFESSDSADWLRGGTIEYAGFAFELRGKASAQLAGLAPPHSLFFDSRDAAVERAARAYFIAKGLLVPARAASDAASTGMPAFLRMVEEVGEAALPARIFRERVGTETTASLEAAGLFGDAPANGKRDTLSISHHAFEDLVADLYGAETVRMRAPVRGPMKKVGEQRAKNGSAARDVFLTYRPWDASLSTALALRERAERRTLLLVPTATELSAELLAHYGPGARVEIALLEDALEIVDARIVRNGTKAAAPREKRIKWRTTRGRGIPRPNAWSEVYMYRVDDEHSVLIQVGKTRVRATYADLEMSNDGAPSVLWELLMLIVRGSGRFSVGGRSAVVKMRLSRLRDVLQRVFGLPDDPFEEYNRKKGGWRPKFHAERDPPYDYEG